MLDEFSAHVYSPQCAHFWVLTWSPKWLSGVGVIIDQVSIVPKGVSPSRAWGLFKSCHIGLYYYLIVSFLVNTNKPILEKNTRSMPQKLTLVFSLCVSSMGFISTWVQVWRPYGLRAEKGFQEHGSWALQKDNAHIQKCPAEKLEVPQVTSPSLRGFSLGPVVPRGSVTGATWSLLQVLDSAGWF